MQQADNKPSLQHSDTPSVKRSWWHRWVLIFGCLNLLVLISSLVNYLTVKLGLVNTTGTITYWLALKGQFPTWYPIVVFAPFIIWFGRRFPIDRHRWQRALVVHVTLSVLFTIL